MWNRSSFFLRRYGWTTRACDTESKQFILIHMWFLFSSRPHTSRYGTVRQAMNIAIKSNYLLIHNQFMHATCTPGSVLNSVCFSIRTTFIGQQQNLCWKTVSKLLSVNIGQNSSLSANYERSTKRKTFWIFWKIFGVTILVSCLQGST